MLEWQDVNGGRARTLAFGDVEAGWVRVADDGTVHFFSGVSDPAELDDAVPVGDLAACIEQLSAVDAIDIMSRALGGADPGPMWDG